MTIWLPSILDVQRKLLKAQDGYLDALFAYTQALADLAQAVGDPGLALGLYRASEHRDGAAPAEKTSNHGTARVVDDPRGNG